MCTYLSDRNASSETSNVKSAGALYTATKLTNTNINVGIVQVAVHRTVQWYLNSHIGEREYGMSELNTAANQRCHHSASGYRGGGKPPVPDVEQTIIPTPS